TVLETGGHPADRRQSQRGLSDATRTRQGDDAVGRDQIAYPLHRVPPTDQGGYGRGEVAGARVARRPSGLSGRRGGPRGMRLTRPAAEQAVAATSGGLEQVAIPAQRFADGGDVNVKRVLDHRLTGPHPPENFVFRDHLARGSNQNPDDLE